MIGLGAYAYVHWELSFLLTDWKGWLIMGVYGLVTLGTMLSTDDVFRKFGKARRGIPAFGVGNDRFIIYDNAGLANEIPFVNCDEVRFKRTRHYRGALPTLTLIIRYRSKADPDDSTTVEFNLSELDRPQNEIDKQLNKVYRNYKKSNSCKKLGNN